MPKTTKEIDEQVWQLVSAIPKGRVTSYGSLARLAGAPRHARLVGRILARLPPETRLPWHRVVNGTGRITNPNSERQISLLLEEDVPVLNGRVNIRRYGWPD